jgi:hypothetical protein
MNPLDWKREHQIAFFCAAALGCLVGIIAGILMLNLSRFQRLDWVPLEYWLLLALWAALGAIICAAVVYIRQLLRT